MKIHDLKLVTLNKKNFMAPFYGWSSTTRNTWYSFDWPQKDERLSPPGVPPSGFEHRTLDWESSALTTRPML